MDFRAKVGPLPIWSWGLLIGGAAVAYMYWSGHRATTTVPSGDTPTTDSSGATSDAIDGAFAPGTTSGSGLTDTQQDNLADSGSLFSNNATWEAAAVAYGVGRGMNPLALQRALEKYLAGATLTTSEGAMVNAVVAGKGIPPEGTAGLPRVLGTPPPLAATTTTTPRPTITHPAPPPTKAAKPHTAAYVVRSGDTLTKIAAHYGTSVKKIAGANGIHDINHIAVGQKLTIPK